MEEDDLRSSPRDDDIQHNTREDDLHLTLTSNPSEGTEDTTFPLITVTINPMEQNEVRPSKTLCLP